MTREQARKVSGIGALIMVALLLTAFTLGVSTYHPRGFPQDFPIPPGPMVGNPPQPSPSGFVVYTVEPQMSVDDAAEWFARMLDGSRWRNTLEGGMQYIKYRDGSVAIARSDDSYFVSVVIVGHGARTDVIMQSRRW